MEGGSSRRALPSRLSSAGAVGGGRLPSTDAHDQFLCKTRSRTGEQVKKSSRKKHTSETSRLTSAKRSPSRKLRCRNTSTPVDPDWKSSQLSLGDTGPRFRWFSISASLSYCRFGFHKEFVNANTPDAGMSATETTQRGR